MWGIVVVVFSCRLFHEDVVLCVFVRGHIGTNLFGLLQLEHHLLILIFGLHNGWSEAS